MTRPPPSCWRRLGPHCRLSRDAPCGRTTSTAERALETCSGAWQDGGSSDLGLRPSDRWLVDEAFRRSRWCVWSWTLNTHRAASLYETFPAAEARRIAKRLEFHYTPKHGSHELTWRKLSSVWLLPEAHRVMETQALVRERNAARTGIMTRLWIILGLFAAIVTAISAAVILETSTIEKAEYSQILHHRSGDSDVIAIVEGRVITRGEIRIAADLLQQVDPSFTNDLAVEMVTTGWIDRFIIQAEVKRRGLVPTRAEAEAYLQPHKEGCLEPEVESCREHIKKLGRDLDDYWDDLIPEYQMDLGVAHLLQAVIEENGLQDADKIQILNLLDTFKAKLRVEAVITWQDEELERLYQEAIESR